MTATADAMAGLEAARRILRRPGSVVVLTGAGISADSGLPTFRGEQGLWKSHRPEELATPGAFARDPRLVWEWYGVRRQKALASRPNEAHLAIARFALQRGNVAIVTQNVDGLHTAAAREAAASCDADAEAAVPIELHGCLLRVRCTACDERYRHDDEVDASSEASLPRCRGCSGLLRPDVVWFGEPLGRSLELAFALASSANVCLAIGTSAVVQPAASVAAMTVGTGGDLIEVNPRTTPLTASAAVSFRAGAVDAVPALLRGC